MGWLCSGWRWTHQAARKVFWCPLDCLFFTFCFLTELVARGLCMPECCVCALSLGKKNAGSHPKVWAHPLVPWGWSNLLSFGAALAVHWRAWACRLSPCNCPLNGAAFLKMSSVSEGTTLQLKSKSQLSHLNALKYYFFPPIWWHCDLLSIDLLPDQTIQV